MIFCLCARTCAHIVTSLLWRRFKGECNAGLYCIFTVWLNPCSGGHMIGEYHKNSLWDSRVASLNARALLNHTSALTFYVHLLNRLDEILLCLSRMRRLCELCTSSAVRSFALTGRGVASREPAQHWRVACFCALYATAATVFTQER